MTTRDQHDQHAVAISVRLPADLRAALKERARQEDRSVASLLRLAAQQYLRAGRESSGGNR